MPLNCMNKKPLNFGENIPIIKKVKKAGQVTESMKFLTLLV